MRRSIVTLCVALFAVAWVVEAGGERRAKPAKGRAGKERRAKGGKSHAGRLQRELTWRGRELQRTQRDLARASGEYKELLEAKAACLKPLVERLEAAKQKLDAGDEEGAREIMKSLAEARRQCDQASAKVKVLAMTRKYRKRVDQYKALAKQLADDPDAAKRAGAMAELLQKRLDMYLATVELENEIRTGEQAMRELKRRAHRKRWEAKRKARTKEGRKGKDRRGKGRRKGAKPRRAKQGKGGEQPDHNVIE